MNTALHSTAQASAISSTINAAGILCLRSAERMGWISMAAPSNGFQLRRWRHDASTPRRQQARDDARYQCKHEGNDEHRNVHVRETRVLRRLMADRPQAELREDQSQHAARDT